jgi:hypothetical protein
VFSSRARAKRDTGDFAGAIEDFGRAIRLDPDSGFLWGYLTQRDGWTQRPMLMNNGTLPFNRLMPVQTSPAAWNRNAPI